MNSKTFLSSLFICILIGVFTPKVKADTIFVDLSTKAAYDSLIVCHTDTLNLFNTSYPNPDGWIYNGIVYNYLSYIIVTSNSFSYTEDGVNWNTIYGNTNGLWWMDRGPGPGMNFPFYIYFTTPISEPFPNPAESICGTSGTLYAGHYENGIYYTWWQDGNLLPQGYYPNDTSFNYIASGEYVLEMIGGCNNVRDTVNITLVDNTPPDLGPDVTFCGDAGFFHQIDCHPIGSGDTYIWSTGETDVTFIQTSTPGIYWVEITNACLTIPVRDSVEIFEYVYPNLNIGTNYGLCVNDTITLDMGYNYEFMAWYSASSMNLLSNTQTINISEETTLIAYAQVNTCPSMTSDTIHISLVEPYSETELCVATVDASGHNKIVWSKENNQGIDYYNVYRLNIGYELVGTVNFADPAVFYDQSANPMASAYRYKVSVVDTCGNESALSPYHSTIHIISSNSTFGGIDLTVTDSYEDESGNFVPSLYYILCDTFNDGNAAIVDSMNAVYNSKHIQNPYPGASYAMAVLLPWNCDTLGKSANNLSVSNKVTPTASIKEWYVSTLTIFPNPATNQIRIEGISGGMLRLYDLTGKLLLEQNNIDNTLELGGIAAGSYVIEWRSVDGIGRGRVVVE